MQTLSTSKNDTAFFALETFHVIYNERITIISLCPCDTERSLYELSTKTCMRDLDINTYYQFNNHYNPI